MDVPLPEYVVVEFDRVIEHDVGHGDDDILDINSERKGCVTLRIHIYEENFFIFYGERSGKIDGRRRLAASALVVRYGYYFRHS